MARFICFLSLAILWPSSAQAKSWLFVSSIQEKRILAFTRDHTTGEITLQNETKCDAEPGVLYPSPDRKTLFVAMRSTGQLASYAIDADGKLTQRSLVEGGDDPCYFFVDRTGQFLLTAYYIANQITVHRIDDSGQLSKQPLQVVKTTKNAHSIHLDLADKFAFVPHTGGNQIFQFRFDPRNGPLIPTHPKSIKLDAGDEPRHVAIHPNGHWVYSNNEAGDSLNAFQLDRDTGQLARTQKITTLREGFDPAKNTTARCEMTRDGRFIYVANRGSHAIAAFAIDAKTGKLTSRGIIETEKTPRSLSIDPTGTFLYAAGQDNGYLRLYRIQPDGSLQSVKRYEVGPTPWCVLAVNVP